MAITIDEIANFFPDYQLILSPACESCLNIPITVAGQVIGKLNCLNKIGYYTDEKVIAAESLKTVGAPAFLIAKSYKRVEDCAGVV